MSRMQVWFNAIWERAKKPVRSTIDVFNDDNLTCAYRGDQAGTACFVGVLIPDELYDPEMEGKPVNQSVSVLQVLEKAYGGDKLSGSEMEFLSEAQGIHDHQSIDYWERRLRNLAAEYHLQCPKGRGGV